MRYLFCFWFPPPWTPSSSLSKFFTISYLLLVFVYSMIAISTFICIFIPIFLLDHYKNPCLRQRKLYCPHCVYIYMN